MTFSLANAGRRETLPGGIDLRGVRARTLALGLVSLGVICAIALGAAMTGDDGLGTHLLAKKLPPSWDFPFGTDPLGRDMAIRTLKGLALSLRVGVIASFASSLIALVLALAAATLGSTVDHMVGVLVDTFFAVPHLVLLILVSFALGGGTSGVIVAVAVSHWPRITRVLRAEILQVLSSDYVRVAHGFGRSPFKIAVEHLVPHLIPQVLVGFLLLFPHAILHEAGLTFLGFGIEPNRPAVGILLAESMRYLTAGYWWLAVFPGLSLLLMVLAFDGLAAGAKALVSPREAQD
ncbi:ABC transporter permease [Telmatospirillum sp.]|uniref:ABC transporter permease n=1 Tax=Telmatospirillum sp. TaxID=2079197 RepID=UPI00284B01F6|nr:ABC transporter permease [Telmatospirillum sp.]MDR3434988.1 ABC transporter permease [Telmatospirillum sp.]